MKTKIVYVLVSSPMDIYLEQAWVSMYSLKLHNPNANITLVVDDITERTMFGYRAKIKEYISDLVIQKIEGNFTPKERSRYLKTMVRQIIKGDFLFLDTDTVITGEIDGIDNLDGEVLLSPEFYHKFQDFPAFKNIVRIAKRNWNNDVSHAEYYYNSGVILCRDTPGAHLLYRRWHKRWLYAAKNKNFVFDQPALLEADMDTNYKYISELPGEYHCQLLSSIKWLYDAKIIHFFNATWLDKTNYSPFFGKKIYLEIQNERSLSEDIKSLIVNCKRNFESPSMVVCKDYMILLVHYGDILCKILSNKYSAFYWVFKFFIIISKVFYLTKSFIAHKQ